MLEALAKAGVPMPADELAAALRIKRRDRTAFDAALEALVREGAVLVNRKGELLVAEKLDLVRGRVQGHPDGFGFLVPETGGPDLFLSPREMHKALHGDRVAGRVTGTDRRGRPAAKCSRRAGPDTRAPARPLTGRRGSTSRGARAEEIRARMPLVKVKDNEPFELAMKRFKKQVEKAGILTELRRREFFDKPSVRRKKKAAAARKRALKKLKRMAR